MYIYKYTIPIYLNLSLYNKLTGVTVSNVRKNAVEIVVLIALAIIAQVIVGVLGQVTQVAGNTLTANTIAYNNFQTAGQSVTTVLNFMSIIFLIAAVVLLLKMFGMENIFRFGGKEGRGD